MDVYSSSTAGPKGVSENGSTCDDRVERASVFWENAPDLYIRGTPLLPFRGMRRDRILSIIVS